MTERQLKFAHDWMAMFDYDYKAMASRLHVKKLAGDNHVDFFPFEDAEAIWEYIEKTVKENT